MDADPLSHEYDMLLPGEMSSIRSGDPRDVEHWIRVYAELVRFKEKILDEIGVQRESVGAEGRIEVQHDDVLFRREYTRLKRRYDYWQNERELREAKQE